MVVRYATAAWVVFAASTSFAQTPLNYHGFRNTTGLNLIGQSAVVGSALRLVPSARNSRGDVWVQSPIAISKGFHASFSFRYWHHGGGPDANGNPGNDGLFFVVQPLSNALELNIDMPQKSLSLFFDGYRNQGSDDVSSSRVAARANGVDLGQTDLEPLGVRFRTGQIVRVDVNFDGSTLCVMANDRMAVRYEHLDLGWTDRAFVGFHGMGGYSYADVDILDFRIEPARPVFAGAPSR